MNEHHVDLNDPEAVAIFVPLPPEPTAVLRTILASARIGLRQLNEQLARESQVGGQRGLLILLFETPTMASMQPARFVRAEHWTENRMFQHKELERTLRTYHLDRGYLVLAIVPHDRQPNTAAYAWWFQPYGSKPRS